jgi:hypothetical protein
VLLQHSSWAGAPLPPTRIKVTLFGSLLVSAQYIVFGFYMCVCVCIFGYTLIRILPTTTGGESGKNDTHKTPLR